VQTLTVPVRKGHIDTVTQSENGRIGSFWEEQGKVKKLASDQRYGKKAYSEKKKNQNQAG